MDYTQRRFFVMNTECILVISERPLLREGLKLIIEEATSALVTTATKFPRAVNRATDLGSSLMARQASATPGE